MAGRNASLRQIFKDMNEMRKLARAEGWKSVAHRVYQHNEFLYGEYKGCDGMGNKYYENADAQEGRQRFVVHADFNDHNANSVPAEWHSWLHYMEDTTPHERPPYIPAYKLPHQPSTLSKQGARPNYIAPGSWAHFNKEKKPQFGLVAKYKPWEQPGAGKH